MEFQKFRVPLELESELHTFYSEQAVFALSELEQVRTELSKLFGVYILFYRGGFNLYSAISKANSVKFHRPIYVGKAVAEGARTGKAIEGASPRNSLFRRLREHRTSISATENLNSSEFFFRIVAMDAALVDWAESVLINKLKPVWNTRLSGFGIHDPGKGRYEQARSIWDQLHPGRSWTLKMQNLAAYDLEILRKSLEEE